MRIEVVCSDPAVAFAGEWPGPEDAAGILEWYRARARALGVPVQVAIERQGVWSIAPTGKVVLGSLFDLGKLEKPAKAAKPGRTRSKAKGVR